MCECVWAKTTPIRGKKANTPLREVPVLDGGAGPGASRELQAALLTQFGALAEAPVLLLALAAVYVAEAGVMIEPGRSRNGHHD